MLTKYTKISDADYHALSFISQSKLKHLIDLNYNQFLIESDQKFDSMQMAFGTAAHSINLEGIDLESSYSIIDRLDGRTKEGKEQAKKLAEIKNPLFREDLERLKKMNANFKIHKESQMLMEKAAMIEHYAVAGIHNDRFPKNTIFMKFKPDIVGVDFIADYKTIGDYATDRNIAKAMKNYHYPFQAASYLALDKLITGTMKRNYFWIFQETIEPYGVRVVTIDDDTLQIGFDKFDKTLNKYIDAVNYPSKQTANYKGISNLSLLYY